MPQNVAVTAGDGKLTLTWQAPSSWGTWPAAAYLVDWKFPSDSDTAINWRQIRPAGMNPQALAATSTSYEFTGTYVDIVTTAPQTVTNGVSYDLRIIAMSQQPGTDGSQNSHFRFSSAVKVLNNIPGTPAAPTNLVVTLGNAQLSLAWNAPTGTLTGYDVHYTSAVAGTVANDAAASGNDPAAAWVAVSRTEASPPTASQTISSLSNATAYRVRVRAKNANGNGAWVFGTGTPSASIPVVQFQVANYDFSEGLRQTFRLSVSPAPTSAITVSLSHTAGTATAATGSTCGGSADYVLPATSVTVAASATTSNLITVTTCADRVVGDDETFTLTVAAGTGYTVGTTSSATVTVQDATLTVSLSASPNPVREGSSVTVTATRSGEGPAATIPVTVTAGTAEPGDHGTLTGIPLTAGATSGTATISTTADTDTQDETFTVALNTASLPLPHGAGSPSSLTVTITDVPEVSLSASPNPVSEGQPVTVTATLSAALSGAVTIPVTVSTVSPNTAESGDVGTLTSITIAANSTSGTGSISTNQDADADDETFTVSLGTLPSSVRAGSTNSVPITIDDDENTTSPVSLSASPNPVTEGSPVTVRATLSSALASAVTIPLTVTDNTAESGDHGSLASITIASGQTSGTGSISTNQDADTDNEIFTVALNTASLPSTVTAGTPSSVQITINDDDASEQRVETPTDDPPTDGGPTGDEQVEREPVPLQLALWTDRPGYRAGETVRLYHTLDPHDDDGSYRTFLYLEQAGGGERRFLSPLQGGGQLHADAVDRYGLRADTAVARALAAADRVLSWEGEAPAPGQWHFVLELRPGEPSQRDGQPDGPSPTTRRAWAKFTVAERTILLNRRGFDREIRSDATLRSDTLYYLGHQLFVRDGATLTLQPGTVLLAFGRHAAIIVEPGGRIVAEGTRQAPVVLTCSAPVGQREPGCWGGLRILGKAPVTRLEGVAPGVLPAERAAYGGSDADGSSGLLRYVRVEFAGASGEEPDAAGPAIGLYGAGSATLLDHVQARHSLGSGFALSGGSARCDRCVASSSGSAGLAWDRGWRGSAAHLYVQHGPQGLHGLDGGNDEQGHDREPRSLPTLSNVTLLHSQPYGRRARRAAGVHLRTGSGLRARDLLASRFGGGGVQAGPRAGMLFTEGESSLAGALLYLNGAGRRQLRGLGLRDALEYINRKPDLRDVRYFANPDPRPKPDSPALADEGEGYIGAFGRKDNWLEQWTVFGPESVYDLRERSEDEN